MLEPKRSRAKGAGAGRYANIKVLYQRIGRLESFCDIVRMCVRQCLYADYHRGT
jgi:hypothetical protein